MALPAQFLDQNEEQKRLQGLLPPDPEASLVPMPPSQSATPSVTAPAPEIADDAPPPAPPPAPAQAPQPAIMRGVPNDPRFGQFLKQETAPQQDDNRGARILSGILSGLAGTGDQNARFWEQRDAEQKAEEAKNPLSASSAKSRASYAPLLKQMGLKDEEIANLTADDIKQMGGGGNLVEGLMKARTTAEQRKAAEAERIAAENRAAQRARDQADYTGNTPAEKERIAGITAGQGLEREKAITDYKHGVETRGATPVDLTQAMDRLNGMFDKNPPQALMARLDTVANLPDDKRPQAMEAFWKDVEAEKQKKEAEKQKESTYVTAKEVEDSNPHVIIDNDALLRDTQATSKRSVGDIRSDIKTAERAGHMYDQMLKDEDAWAHGDAKAKAEVIAAEKAGAAYPFELSDEAKNLASVKSRYDAFATELQGVKARIAQSAGSAAEREDSKHEIPSIMASNARSRLIGIGGMLESNANANLAISGAKFYISKERARAAKESSRGKSRENLGTTPKAGPKVSAVVGKQATKPKTQGQLEAEGWE